jgi:rhamnogalacturonyl hydrolase YesR
MPENHPERQKLIDSLAATLEGFLRHQCPSGLWKSLITAGDGEGREESSGTWMALVVFARAYWKGWIRDERIPEMCESAWRGLKTRIWRGLPVGMCLGTPRFPSPECYNTSLFGGFMGMPLLLAKIEMERMKRIRR